VLRASFGGAFNPAAAPFRLSGAMEASRDLDCLTDAVYYEARGETPSGQAAVAQVVLNRVRHPAFPKTVCGVVFQGASSGGVCQFSFACDGSMGRRREGAAWARAEKVAARALSGYVMTEVGNATHFHTIKVSPGWGPRMLRVAQVGLHIFYRFGGRTGAPDAFTDRPSLSIAEGFDTGTPLYGTQPAQIPATGARPAPELILASALVAPGMGGPLGRSAEPASAAKVDGQASKIAPLKTDGQPVKTAAGKPDVQPVKTAPKSDASPVKSEELAIRTAAPAGGAKPVS
jgi:hypothetical protein